MENAIKAKSKISSKNWVIIWIVGLAGQLCWNVENQWFNTFVYAEISPNASIVSWMVGVSAAVTTFSTFLMGTWSDRVGKRRPFIGFGYILWGISTVVFGATEYIPAGNLFVVATMVVFADAVMSFFGSAGNDAGFNPWTTDITDETNRGNLGAVIAIHPVIATIIGTVGSGIIIEWKGYFFFFILVGIIMSAIGLYSLIFVKDAPGLKPNRTSKSYWRQFWSAFNFPEVFKNKLLLLTFLIFSAFFISFNVYFPHIMNYFIYTLGYSEGDAGIIMGAGLILAIPFTFIAGKFINKGKFIQVLCASVAVNIAGLLVFSLPGMAAIVIGIILIGAGYMCVYQALMIWAKNLYPEDKRAQFEGIRLLFYVCIPMIVGPLIGTPVIKLAGFPMQNSYGEAGFSASWVLFIVAAAVALITYIPIYFASKEQKRLSLEKASNKGGNV